MYVLIRENDVTRNYAFNYSYAQEFKAHFQIYNVADETSADFLAQKYLIFFVIRKN